MLRQDPNGRPRRQRLGAEVARFSAVNGVATVVSVGLFNLGVHGIGTWFAGPLHGAPGVAYVVANLVGMLISFVGSRRYAFRNREPVGPAGGLLNYAVVNTASFVVPVTFLWVSRNVLHQDGIVADNLAANVLGALAAMAVRYWAFKRFVFRRRRPWMSRVGTERRPAGE